MLHYDRQPGFNHLTHFIERAPSHDVRLFTRAFFLELHRVQQLCGVALALLGVLRSSESALWSKKRQRRQSIAAAATGIS